MTGGGVGIASTGSPGCNVVTDFSDRGSLDDHAEFA
jgi:hypothetical protein